MPNPAAVAYEAYRRNCGGKSLISGAPLPAWDCLPDSVRAAWFAAAAAVLAIRSPVETDRYGIGK